MGKPTYAPEDDMLIYHAECGECDALETFSQAAGFATSKALRRAKAWARRHMAEEHDGSGSNEYVAISRIVGYVA